MTISRASIEAAIESLIAVLDELDGDPDLEDGGDLEPSLAHTATGAWGRFPSSDIEEVINGAQYSIQAG